MIEIKMIVSFATSTLVTSYFTVKTGYNLSISINAILRMFSMGCITSVTLI